MGGTRGGDKRGTGGQRSGYKSPVIEMFTAQNNGTEGGN